MPSLRVYLGTLVKLSPSGLRDSRRNGRDFSKTPSLLSPVLPIEISALRHPVHRVLEPSATRLSPSFPPYLSLSLKGLFSPTILGMNGPITPLYSTGEGVSRESAGNHVAESRAKSRNADTVGANMSRRSIEICSAVSREACAPSDRAENGSHTQRGAKKSSRGMCEGHGAKGRVHRAARGKRRERPSSHARSIATTVATSFERAHRTLTLCPRRAL